MSSRSRWINRFAKRSAVVLAAASATASFTNSLWAATGTFTYTAGGTSWTNATAWLFGNPYPGQVANEIANFTAVDLAPIGPANYPITVDTNLILGAINFTDLAAGSPGGWSLIQGGTSTLTLDTGTAAQPIINVNGLGSGAVAIVDMQVPLYGTKGFIKAGSSLLRLSVANALTGSLNVQQGTLEISTLANLGGTDATITLSSFAQNATNNLGGILSLRSDTALDLSGKTLVVNGSTANNFTANVLNVDRSATNPTTAITGVFHNVGTILMASGGARQLNIVGSNFFGLNVGTLVLDSTNSGAVLNNLSPGQLTIGTVTGGSASTAATLTFGGTNNAALGNGNNIVVTNAITQTNVSGTLSVVYSDAHTMNVGSFVNLTGNLVVNGGGTLIVSAGRLPTGSLGVTGGTLDFSTTGLVSTVTHLQMGGRNNSGAYINTGTGTGGLEVLNNVTFSASTGGTGGVIDGKLAFGSGTHTLQINGINGIPTQEMTVNAAVSGSGTLNKNGTGQILLTGANSLSAAVVINQGTFSGAARGSGNAFTTGPVTVIGGALRLVNQDVVPGSGSIGSLAFDGAATNPAILVVDSGTSSSATALNIGAFLGRVSGSSGALTVIPNTGGLDTTEIITVGSMASGVSTATNHGILAPYVAAQVSSSNSSIDFLATSGTHIVGGGAAYQTGDINSVTTNQIYSATNAQSLGSPKQMFAIKADGTLANVTGAAITLGDGNLAGLIVNNGAQINNSNLVINAAEAIFWAGGRVLDLDGTTVLAAGGSISSNISFATTAFGNLTTSGSQTITLSGGFNMGGVSRTVTVSNGTAVFGGAVSNGNLTKSGPNYLILNNANAGMAGNLNVTAGTLQVGQGNLTPGAGIGSATATIGNGNFVLNLDGVNTLPNYFTSTGTGALIVNSPTGVVIFNNATSSFSSLTINAGAVQLNANNQLPATATLTVQNTGSFNMNGFSQTIGVLGGTAGTGIVSNAGAGLSTLTINNNSTSTGTLTPTFTGQITNGAGLAVNKLGTGTQILGGPSTYAGGTRLVAGTLQLQNNTAAGTGSIQFLGGNLAMTGVTIGNVLTIGNSAGTVGVINNGSNGTISGAILVGSSGTLNVVFGGTGQTLNVPNISAANFTGTVALNTPGNSNGSFKVSSGLTAGSTYDLSAATINFGTAAATFGFNQGSVTVTMPFITGGTNAILGSGANGRTNHYLIGTQGGNQVFNGVVQDNGSPTELTKIGNGTFTLSSSATKNHNLTGDLIIQTGTFVVGNNAVLSADGRINIFNGVLAMASNGTMTGNKTVNLSEQGSMDVTQVPGGFSTPPTATITNTGYINGAYTHGAGTLAPGAFNGAGTITFNTLANPSALTLGAGVLNMDISKAGSLNVGGGTNDLIVVNGDINFNPNALIRVNYIGNGTVTAGEDYPILFYTGGTTGFGAGSLSTTSGIVSSAFRSSFSLRSLGGGVIAAHVNSFGGAAQSMIWTGSTSQAWDLNITQNFKIGNAATTFFQNDTVTFDNTGVNRPTISLTNAIYLPAAVIFNNGSNVVNYIMTGPGTISGNTGMLMSGSGTATVQTANTFVGNTTITSGTLFQGDFQATRFGTDVINSPFGLGTIYVGNVNGTATIGFGNTTFVNDVFVGAGQTANVNFNNGSVSMKGQFLGSGTINLVGGGGNSNWYADNSGATGTVNVLGSGITIRIGNQLAPGNIYWNFLGPRNMTTILNDPATTDIAIGGLAGSGGLTALASGASVTGDKTWIIGGSNRDSTWNGNISNSTSGSGGNGITGIICVASVTKAGTGNLILTGVNVNYTGETVVRSGVLELSNTGGPGVTAVPNGGVLTGTRVVRVQNGGTFRLGTPGGGVLAGNNGTITTAATGLLLTVDAGGKIDVTNAYDDKPEVDPDSGEVLSYGALKTANAVTWAGNGGTIIGNIRHSSGTISPGRDTGSGAIGTLNFANTLELFNGAVNLDVGSVSSAADRLVAQTLNIGGGNVVVNIIGNSIPANGVYTIMTANSILNSVSSFAGLILNGRGATGSLIQGGVSSNEIQLKIATPAVSDKITWNGGSGGTWDAKGGSNWLNHNNTSDYFYHGDTVTFTDQGAGTIQLAYNLTPGGEVVVNNTSTTYTFVGPGKITGNASLHKKGPGTLVIVTDNDYTGGTIIDAGGTLAVGKDLRNDANGSYVTNNTAANGTLLSNNKTGLIGTGSIVNNGNLVIRKTNAMVITQNISGSGALYYQDWGVLELRGTNTYTGGTTVSWGVLKLGHANALSTTGSITLLGTTNFTGGANFDPTGRGGRIDLNGFAQTIDELNSFGVGGAANTPNPGPPTDAYIQNNATLISNIATLTINRTGPLGFNSGIHNGAEGNGDPVGQIALVKQSPGVATMNYTSTGTIATNYSGLTSVNGGTLLVRGFHVPAGVGRGTYTIANTAALGGDGGISAQVNVQPGGIIAAGIPGDANFGTFNIASLSMNAGNLNFDLTGSNTDLLDVNNANAWLLSGASHVNLNVVGSLNAGTFDLVNYSGALIPDLLTKVTLGSITNGSTFNFFLASDTQNSKLQLIVTQPIVSATWQVDASGTWGTAANWTTNPTTPNAFGSTANFGSIASPRTVTMDGPFQIGTANFTSAAAFTIQGSAITTLTFGGTNPGDTVGINVTQGSHAINAPMALNNNVVLSVAAGSTLSFGGGFGFSASGASSGHNVTKTGTGTLVADSIRNTFGNNGSALFNITQGTVRMAHHSTANAAEGTSKVNSLTIANGAKLDLTNNSMVLDYAAALGGDGSAIITQLKGWLKSTDGRLYSSEADATHAIGYKDNSDITGAANKGVSNFGGVVVDGSAILMKYTYRGDTNVDGQVDLNDLYNLASNYNPNHTGSATSIWQKGDSNYDGWVDLQDLTILATNWQAGVGNPLGSGLGPILTSLGLPQVAVPEPATIGLMGLGLTGLMARRRRRN